MRVKGSKKPKVFRNYIKVMRKLCEVHKAQEQVGLWFLLFAWKVMSDYFFQGHRTEHHGGEKVFIGCRGVR